MIALFAAMRLEVQRFLRRLEVRDHSRLEGFPVTLGEYGGRPVLVCLTGMGRRAEAAVRAVLDRHQPRMVLSVGVGGALSPELSVGDLVVCESVERASSGPEEAEPVCSDEELLRLADAGVERAGLKVRRGRSLTVDRVVGDPAEKDALRRSQGPDVVEMESYWVGRAALDKRLPFLAVRAISDGIGDPVPHIPGAFTPEGELQMHRVLAYVLRRPARIPLLLRLARGNLKAVANLTRFLESFTRAELNSAGGQT
ncbi:MAG: hypothetical protein V3S20_03545 [Dehalococcoidia bacterium]